MDKDFGDVAGNEAVNFVNVATKVFIKYLAVTLAAWGGASGILSDVRAEEGWCLSLQKVAWRGCAFPSVLGPGFTDRWQVYHEFPLTPRRGFYVMATVVSVEA
eukprot:519009-Rhodomonas_salina.2